MDRKNIPSVDVVLNELQASYPAIARERLLSIARAVLADARQAKVENIPAELERRIDTLRRPSLRRVINASGVILHTNLGRAPLMDFAPVTAYSNLEYDLASGKRGKRDSHYAPLLEEILGVPAIAVNNNAAATYLVLRALAKSGEVIVSRGELVEIGDGFRIPDIMEQSGARLKEVGATNKTNLDDYRKAIHKKTRMIMRVHPSNFQQSGFVGKPGLSELASLAKDAELPLYEDLGSGCLVDLSPYGINEPLVSASLAAGVDVVSFSCDKLLGGPQAGIIAGRADWIAKIRKHPMYRALRLDKLAVQALEVSLRAIALGDLSRIPALRMAMLPLASLKQRCEALAAQIPGAKVVQGESLLGGGSTPGQAIPTWLIAVPGKLEKQLRANDPPIVARMEKNQTLLDLRCVDEADDAVLAAALKA